MKHIFISLTFVFFTFLSFAQPIKLTIDKINSSNLNVGDTIEVSLNIEKYLNKTSAFQVFLEFDQTVLQFIRTTNINDLFKSTWQENKTENFYTGLFLDFTQQGLIFEKDEILCQLLFVYQGGETDIVWGKVDEVKDGAKVKGRTTFLDMHNKDFDLVLSDGCVCKQ